MSKGNWQQEMQGALTSMRELMAVKEYAGTVNSNEDDGTLAATRAFAVKMPARWRTKIRWNNTEDPLLRQILPVAEEARISKDFVSDPTGDMPSARAGGLLHKYKDRVLIVVTGACAIHCRYCFRRHFPYQEHVLSRDLEVALDYIRQNTEIKEVILSGGDPLTLTNKRLFAIWTQFENVPHIERVRVHTRVPVVVPSRIDDELIEWLNARCRRSVVVLHINHADEIDEEVRVALAGLRTPLLNQSVLLKGVNDSVESLCELSVACFRAGILPYYLHLLDKTKGTAHFEVSLARAKALHAEMRANLPGYLVPRLVREDPGAEAKTPIV